MAYKNPEDQKAYRAKWYAEKYTGEYAKEHRRKVRYRRRISQEFVRAYKEALGCSRCPEKDVACLDLHHTDGTKEVSICQAIMRGWSHTRLFEEMQKCEVLCANCHRKHHYAGIA